MGYLGLLFLGFTGAEFPFYLRGFDVKSSRDTVNVYPGRKTARMPRQLKLPDTDQTARTEVLEPAHLPFVLALQEETRAALPEGQKMFVLPQPASYFEDILARKNGAMIGIWAGNRLVAQMAFMGSLTLEEAIDGQKLTRNDVILHHAELFEPVVIAKSMAVHPDWRGYELSQHMLEYGLALPFVRAASHVFAQISVDNVRSWELFLRNGFGVVAAAVDPDDRKPRFIIQKPALGFALHPMPGAINIDPAADFSAIMRLTRREALVGKLDSNAVFKLAFYASEDTAASWLDAAAG